MNESRFPHLKQYEEPMQMLFQSETIGEYDDPTSDTTMEYQVDAHDKDIVLTIEEDGESSAAFILTEQHIGFLEQLLDDLKEVTGDEYE